MTVVLMATHDSKRAEADHLRAALEAQGIAVRPCDIALAHGGRHLDGTAKMRAMDEAAARAVEAITRGGPPRVAVAIGGGTGGQIALAVLRALPMEVCKVLVSTLPFDPRHAVADSAIILVPTMADLSGLNATTRRALDLASAIVSGLVRAGARGQVPSEAPSIGVTALGVTAPGVDALTRAIRARGEEATVFHANGFGGAAYARWAAAGAFRAVIDYTAHELTRVYVGGACAVTPARFAAAAHLPQVLVPGGVNFIGMGEAHALPDAYLSRPHYAHSALFTHVRCTHEEARRCAAIWGGHIAAATGPVRVLIPMGGFSSEDRPGGAIEDEGLRAAFADALARALPRRVAVERLPHHVNDPAMAASALAALDEAMDRAPMEARA